jgi:hypothetical protein
MVGHALFLIPLALGLAQNQASAPPANSFTVQVGLFSYRADGSNQGSAATGGVAGRFTGNLYAGSGCSLGAGDREAPATAANVWRVAGQIVDMTADSAVVDLQWTRVKDNGQASAANVSQRLTLQPGTPVTIDSAVLAPEGACDIVRVALEARLAPRLLGRGFLGSGGGRSTGAGDGQGTGSGSGGGGGSTVAIAGGARTVAPAGGGQVYSVELWLVRQPAGGPESSTPVLMRVNDSGGSFSFPPVTVSSNEGQAAVTILGTFRVTGPPDARQLTFSTSRRISQERGAGPNRDTFSGNGSSQTTIPLPGPDEVLSFEMPQIKSGSGADSPDRFSVRLRIRPIQ